MKTRWKLHKTFVIYKGAQIGAQTETYIGLQIQHWSDGAEW